MLSLYANAPTNGEISRHVAQIYGASVSKETISRIAEKVIEEMNEWSAPPLEEVYAAVFIDAIVVKIRNGQVGNRPIYAAIGVTLAGDTDALDLRADTGGEDAKFWISVLTLISRTMAWKTRSYPSVMVSKGAARDRGQAWPLATVQTCIIHLIRNTFRARIGRTTGMRSNAM